MVVYDCPRLDCRIRRFLASRQLSNAEWAECYKRRDYESHRFHLYACKIYLIGPILWGHSGPLCHALSLLSSSLLWTSIAQAACDSSDIWWTIEQSPINSVDLPLVAYQIQWRSNGDTCKFGMTYINIHTPGTFYIMIVGTSHGVQDSIQSIRCRQLLLLQGNAQAVTPNVIFFCLPMRNSYNEQLVTLNSCMSNWQVEVFSLDSTSLLSHYYFVLVLLVLCLSVCPLT